eukprot:CAMPEP_0119488350 /NCGR_PEP_ID=MMETSP1344-20130328/14160_1 /TAXON_ID=236787 /ORGANISM="Florenciella parvula, Strain CCMP2471" /LENGTH=137 /DNA_ID=CAMNT_0007523299 /DNA_START=129 /DNA_END=538 /DNA_ORIENTATION=+
MKRGRTLGAVAFVAAAVTPGASAGALAESVGSGRFGKQGVVMDMTLTHPEVGTPLDTSNAVGLFKFESEVSEDLTVGGTLRTNGALLKSVYANFDFQNGFKANWKMEESDEGEGSRLVPSVEIDADSRYKVQLRGDG